MFDSKDLPACFFVSLVIEMVLPVITGKPNY
jgi:hypothetical protein